MSRYTHKMSFVSWPYILWRHFTQCIYKNVARARAVYACLGGLSEEGVPGPRASAADDDRTPVKVLVAIRVQRHGLGGVVEWRRAVGVVMIAQLCAPHGHRLTTIAHL